MSTITQIQAELLEMFAPIDQMFKERQQKWAAERKEALKNLPQTEAYQELEAQRKAAKTFSERSAVDSAMYDLRFNTAGGKTWYINVFYGRSIEMIIPIVEKNCDAVISRRNASIEAKLIKAGVTDLIESKYSSTSDGFHGTFNVVTDMGDKWIEIDTILAGGYNIQCLHNRTLVKVRH